MGIVVTGPSRLTVGDWSAMPRLPKELQSDGRVGENPINQDRPTIVIHCNSLSPQRYAQGQGANKRLGVFCRPGGQGVVTALGRGTSQAISVTVQDSRATEAPPSHCPGVFCLELPRVWRFTLIAPVVTSRPPFFHHGTGAPALCHLNPVTIKAFVFSLSSSCLATYNPFTFTSLYSNPSLSLSLSLSRLLHPLQHSFVSDDNQTLTQRHSFDRNLITKPSAPTSTRNETAHIPSPLGTARPHLDVSTRTQGDDRSYTGDNPDCL